MSISAKHIGKAFGHPAIEVLSDINLEINDGDFIALTGKSGSGKSTLLYLLSSLDTPTSGSISMSGMDYKDLSQKELSLFRNQKMGFVFQFHYLISELTCLENVILPTKKEKDDPSRISYAHELLERFDLKEKLHRLPKELSGGEQQRVAIARSLIMKPKYLFTDEPTGSLDSINGRMVLDILMSVNKELKTTIIMVTHDKEYASLASRQVQLQDGKIILDD